MGTRWKRVWVRHWFKCFTNIVGLNFHFVWNRYCYLSHNCSMPSHLERHNLHFLLQSSTHWVTVITLSPCPVVESHRWHQLPGYIISGCIAIPFYFLNSNQTSVNSPFTEFSSVTIFSLSDLFWVSLPSISCQDFDW